MPEHAPDVGKESHEGILHRPHGGNALGRQDVSHLREFLARGHVTPSLYEAAKKSP